MSHITRAQRTPSAAATVQVSLALPAVRFSCLLRGVAAGEGFVCSVLRCPDLWLQCSVSFVHGFKKDAPHNNNISRRYRQFVGTGCLCKGKSPGRPRGADANMERVREAFQRSPRKSVAKGCVSCDPGCTHGRIVITKCETWTVDAADGVCCARLRWEIHLLFTFETAPFFCVCPVYKNTILYHSYIFRCHRCIWCCHEWKL
jgi:hypothetical protein